MRDFGTFCRQGFIVKFPRRIRIKGQIELIFPPEFKPGFAQCIIAVLRTGMSFGQIGRMGGNFVGDNAVFTSFLLGKPKMFFWRYIAQHGRTKPANHGRANGGGNVVITRSNVRRQRAQAYRKALRRNAPVACPYFL